MDVDNLVHMANRIGDFFASMPDRREAKRDIAQHLRKFWDPRMRIALYEHIDRDGESGLSAIVLQAVTENREELTPPRALYGTLEGRAGASNP